MQKNILMGLGAAALLALVAYVLVVGTKPAPSAPVVVDTSALASTTVAELAAHGTAADCWVAYEGVVYDVTSFIDRHPGGADKIIPFCGKADDFAKAFIGQHGMSGKETNMLKALPAKGKLVP